MNQNIDTQISFHVSERLPGVPKTILMQNFEHLHQACKTKNLTRINAQFIMNAMKVMRFICNHKVVWAHNIKGISFVLAMFM